MEEAEITRSCQFLSFLRSSPCMRSTSC